MSIFKKANPPVDREIADLEATIRRDRKAGAVRKNLASSLDNHPVMRKYDLYRNAIQVLGYPDWFIDTPTMEEALVAFLEFEELHPPRDVRILLEGVDNGSIRTPFFEPPEIRAIMHAYLELDRAYRDPHYSHQDDPAIIKARRDIEETKEIHRSHFDQFPLPPVKRKPIEEKFTFPALSSELASVCCEPPPPKLAHLPSRPSSHSLDTHDVVPVTPAPVTPAPASVTPVTKGETPLLREQRRLKRAIQRAEYDQLKADRDELKAKAHFEYTQTLYYRATSPEEIATLQKQMEDADDAHQEAVRALNKAERRLDRYLEELNRLTRTVPSTPSVPETSLPPGTLKTFLNGKYVYSTPHRSENACNYFFVEGPRWGKYCAEAPAEGKPHCADCLPLSQDERLVRMYNELVAMSAPVPEPIPPVIESVPPVPEPIPPVPETVSPVITTPVIESVTPVPETVSPVITTPVIETIPPVVPVITPVISAPIITPVISAPVITPVISAPIITPVVSTPVITPVVSTPEEITPVITAPVITPEEITPVAHSTENEEYDLWIHRYSLALGVNVEMFNGRHIIRTPCYGSNFCSNQLDDRGEIYCARLRGQHLYCDDCTEVIAHRVREHKLMTPPARTNDNEHPLITVVVGGHDRQCSVTEIPGCCNNKFKGGPRRGLYCAENPLEGSDYCQGCNTLRNKRMGIKVPRATRPRTTRARKTEELTELQQQVTRLTHALEAKEDEANTMKATLNFLVKMVMGLDERLIYMGAAMGLSNISENNEIINTRGSLVLASNLYDDLKVTRDDAEVGLDDVRFRNANIKRTVDAINQVTGKNVSVGDLTPVNHLDNPNMNFCQRRDLKRTESPASSSSSEDEYVPREYPPNLSPRAAHKAAKFELKSDDYYYGENDITDRYVDQYIDHLGCNCPSEYLARTGRFVPPSRYY